MFEESNQEVKDEKKDYNPFVSVIIPFYNVGKYARLCMESLLNQEYSNCEYICVNDGSTDNTPEILMEYEHDRRVKILHKSNGGASSARNYGLDVARGDYITFIDADDYVHPKYLRSLVDATEEHDDRFVISPLQIVKYTESLDIKEGWSESVSHYLLNKESTLEKILYDELSVSPCAKLVPRSAYEDIRFPVGMVSEDVAVIGKLISKFDNYSIIEQPLYSYVMRGNSVGHKKKLSFKEIQDRIETLKIFEKIIKEEFDLDSNDKINQALIYRWGRRLVDLATMYDKVTDDKESVKKTKTEVTRWLRSNIGKIISNKRASIKQRLRILVCAISPKLYCFLISCYQNLKYGV